MGGERNGSGRYGNTRLRTTDHSTKDLCGLKVAAHGVYASVYTPSYVAVANGNDSFHCYDQLLPTSPRVRCLLSVYVYFLYRDIKKKPKPRRMHLMLLSRRSESR